MDSNATRTLKPEITLTGSESKMKSFKPTKSLADKMNTDKRSRVDSSEPIKLAESAPAELRDAQSSLLMMEPTNSFEKRKKIFSEKNINALRSRCTDSVEIKI